jgi:hypothetical protein
MAKKINTRFSNNDYDDESYSGRGYQEDLKYRRKEKRMRNALRTLDVNDLLYLDEEF